MGHLILMKIDDRMDHEWRDKNMKGVDHPTAFFLEVSICSGLVGGVRIRCHLRCGFRVAKLTDPYSLADLQVLV